MTFKLSCVAHMWKQTSCIFVAAVILILFTYTSHQFVYGQDNIIITFIRGTFSSFPQNTDWYIEKPNSSHDYQGDHSLSSFNEANRLKFRRLNPKNISKSNSSIKAPILSRTDTFEIQQYSNILMPSLILNSETSTFNLYDYRTKKIKENVLNKISKDLRFLMSERLPSEEIEVPETCSEEAIGNTCKKGACLQLQLPKDPQIRLEQIVRPDSLHPKSKYLKVMHDMGNAVPGFYDIILITGASSNHYLESKKLLYNIHANVLPHLTNFTIIYYNLGLTVKQKKDISSMCRCHMLDFPFHKFPKFVSLLRCYTWKAIVINSHAAHCNVIHWMDASIRYVNHPSHFKELLQRVRFHGFVGAGFPVRYVSYMTLPEMFHFFGDEPCAYLPYRELASGFEMFLNEPLIKWGILEPWTACALNESCMCLDYVKHPNIALVGCDERKELYDYGRCHRYDQSALSIIVRKLFREKSDHVLLQNCPNFFEVKGGDV